LHRYDFGDGTRLRVSFTKSVISWTATDHLPSCLASADCCGHLGHVMGR